MLGGRWVSALAGVVLLSGCGGVAVGHRPAPAHATKSAATAGQSGASPTALVDQVPRPTPYQPSAVIDPPHGTNPITFTAHLLPATGLDTVTVTVNRQGQGQLVVTGPDRTTLWRLPHVQWAGVLEFPRHAPVLLTQAVTGYCGTGGCPYTAYTWDPHTGQLGPIPFEVWNTPSYYYDPATRTWAVHPDLALAGGPSAASFLGWCSLTSVGLSTDTRTYDADNGRVGQAYRYAAVSGSATGEWISVGPPQFSPTTPYPGYAEVASPGAALALYLTAATDNLPAMAAPLAAPSVVVAKLWAAARPLTTLGVSGDVNPTPLVDPGHAQGLGETVSGVQGSGPDTRLVTYVADAQVTTAGGVARLISLSVKRLPMKIATIAAVLADLAAHPGVVGWFATHPDARVSIVPAGLAWDLTYSNGATGSVNAVNGVLTGMP